jgi:hypothetical protein
MLAATAACRSSRLSHLQPPPPSPPTPPRRWLQMYGGRGGGGGGGGVGLGVKRPAAVAGIAAAAGRPRARRDHTHHGASVGVSTLKLTPLGGGMEVGRSCLVLQFRGRTVMLDCGVDPAFSGTRSLPFFDLIDPADIDVVIITHFHLDHCGALPYLTERLEGFRGRIFATHSTIAVMRLLLMVRGGVVGGGRRDAARVGGPLSPLPAAPALCVH